MNSLVGNNTTGQRIAIGLAAAAFLLATVLGARDLITNGPFQWHIEQLSFRDGALELLVAGVLLTGFQRLRHTRLGYGLCVVVVALYLRRHAIDLALLASAAYCFGIYFLGRGLSRLLQRKNDSLRCDAYAGRRQAWDAALGLVVLTLVLWLPALIFGIGFEATRWLGASTAFVGLLLGLWRCRWRELVLPRADTLVEALTRSLITLGLLAVLARSNTLIYYDSIWYGLRPERVLFGEYGVYNWLGLTTQVHYYPKLFEVVLAPLQGWGDLSLDAGFNVWALLFLAAAIRSVARQHGVDNQRAWVVAAALICLPAYAGVAETTKGDILGAAFVLFGISALRGAWVARAPVLLADVLVFSLLATGLRLSVLPWLAVSFIAALVVWARLWMTVPAQSMDWIKGRAGVAVALTLLAVGLVHYRTLLLSGTPLVTNAETQLLFDRMGLAIRYPIGHFTGGEPTGFREMLSYFPNLALHPSRFVYHVFKWTGALWLAAGVVALTRWVLLPDRMRWLASLSLLLAMAAAFPLLLATNAWPERGGDGNYFLVPVACLSVVGLTTLRRSGWLDGALLACGVIGLTAFLATSNWVAGTSEFTLDFGRSPFDAEDQLTTYLAKADLGYVSGYLQHCNRHTRVTGVLPGYGQAFALPARYEPLQEMQWNNPEAFASVPAFAKLMRATGTQLVVLPNSEKAPYLAGSEAFFHFIDQTLREFVATGSAVEVARRGDFRIYRLTEAAVPLGCPLQ